MPGTGFAFLLVLPKIFILQTDVANSLFWEAKDDIWPEEEKYTLEGTCVENSEVKSRFSGTPASQLEQNSKFLVVLAALIFGVSGQI